MILGRWKACTHSPQAVGCLVVIYKILNRRLFGSLQRTYL